MNKKYFYIGLILGMLITLAISLYAIQQAKSAVRQVDDKFGFQNLEVETVKTFTSVTSTNLFSTNADFTNITWTNATGVNLRLSSTFAPTANNMVSNGTALASWAGVFASGTSQFAGVVMGNSTTTGVAEQGGMVSSPDAGKLTFWTSKIGNNATGTFQGGAIGTDTFPDILTVGCISDGAGGCVASSTVILAKVPIISLPMATTTLMVATATQFLVNEAYGTYNVVASSTVGITTSQIVATTTSQTWGNTCVEFVGTDDTRTVTVTDTAYIHLAGGTSMTLGDGDSLVLCSMASRGYWRERSRSDD